MILAAGESLMLSALGIPIGASLLALLSGEKNRPIREIAAKWCLAFGAISTTFSTAMIAADLDWPLSRGLVGMIFVGLPALPAGLLLRLFPDGLRSVK